MAANYVVEIVLGLSIVIIIIQQFQDVDGLQSPIFIRSSQFFSQHPTLIEFENILNILANPRWLFLTNRQ